MNPVEIYHNISHTQMSIARHYGGLTVNGSTYEYDAEQDRLIRSDIAKRDEKLKASERKKWIEQQKEFNRMSREMERAKQEFMF